jgi:catechol 2,3-dioxygenase-like lactoylglutathione lyase family enzyme
MSDVDRPNDDDRRLIDGLFDGGLAGAPAPSDDLLARLEKDPTARDYLVERAVLHAGLRQSLRRRSLSDWAVSRARDHAASRSRRARGAVLAWLAASACFAAIVIGGLISNRPYATVTVGIGTAGLNTGRPLHGEPYELAAGVLELETRRGAQIVIEAPASFRFESSQRLRLTKGRIAAEVPPQAKGFTVITPSGEAIDLGTRFAVDVPASGAAEVHVFSGEVVARANAKTPTSLRDGEAFSLAANASRELRTAAFIRRGEVAELAAALAAGQQGQSQEASGRLREDLALIAAIDFEGGDHPGQYRVVQGRWPGSRAADFTNIGDYLSLDVGGDANWPQLTVAAWVRLDRLGEPYQSLYHTDGWSKENPGQVHWMIVDSGVMRLALPGWRLAAGAIERHEHPESRTPVLGTEGRWMHLAFVYDADARTASFYVDGRPDGVTELEFAPPARLGPARVGNWNAKDRKLSGRIDELVFVGRALSADEIRDLYETGVPYR